MSPNNNNHGERIASLEAGLSSLTSSLQKLADIVSEQAQAQAAEHAQTRREINGVADKLSNFARPNYGALIGAGALTCTIIGAVIAPTHMELNLLREQTKEDRAILFSHISQPSHPVISAIFAEKEKAEARERELTEKLYDTKLELLKRP